MSVPVAVSRAVEGDRAAWYAFVASRGEADILQAWVWGDAVAATGPKRGANVELPERIVVKASDGSIRGVAQAMVRPTSFGKSIIYVPHGPVWDREAGDAPAILLALVDGLRDLARDRGGIGIKMDPRAQVPAPDGPDRIASGLADLGFQPASFDLQARTTRILDLEIDEAARIAPWSGEARNRWRRALKEGSATVVVRRPEPAALSAFVGLLDRTATHGGFRTREPAFYEALASSLADDGAFHLAVTSWSDRPIAAMFVVSLGDRAYYLYGASDRDVPRHTYGPYAAMAAMLAALAEDGVRTLDLWGVAEPDDPTADPTWAGFSEFKIRFDGVPVRHPGTFDLAVDPIWWALRGARERIGRRR